MAGVSGPALAAAVADAGGMGMLGAAFYKDGDELRRCVVRPHHGQTPASLKATLQLQGPRLHRNWKEALQLRHGDTHGLGIGLVGFGSGTALYETAIDLKPHAIVSCTSPTLQQIGVPLSKMCVCPFRSPTCW